MGQSALITALIAAPLTLVFWLYTRLFFGRALDPSDLRWLAGRCCGSPR